MEHYYFDKQLKHFQPDARHLAGPVPAEIAERRKERAVRTTSEQYHFLAKSLERREDGARELAKHGRRVKHLLFATCLFLLAVAFPIPGSNFEVALFGNKLPLTALHLHLLAPLLIAYLVLVASFVTAKRLQLQTECWLIESELQRFGCPTGYSTIRDFHHWRRAHRQGVIRQLHQKLYAIGGWAYDVVLAGTVLLTMAIASAIAVTEAWRIATSGGWFEITASLGYFVVLALALIGAVVAPALLKRARPGWERLVREYKGVVALRSPLDQLGEPQGSDN